MAGRSFESHLQERVLSPETWDFERTLPSPLREYQREGVSFLFNSDGALLADEMGLGKTVQAALALALVMRLPDVNRALIVAPAALTLNWERELARWAPSLVVRRVEGDEDARGASYLLPIPVLIASYEQIRIDSLDRIPQDTFDLVVLDEAQRVKNHESRVAFACRLLPRRRAWALTATPVENSRRDLEAVFAFIAPGLVSRRDTKEQLFAKAAPHLLRRRKRDVLGELPPVIIQDVSVELTSQQRLAYDAVWETRQAVLDAQEKPVQAVALLALITKLKQVCNFDGPTNESSKLDALREAFDAARGVDDKIILFSQYVTTLEWISSQLGGIRRDLYHGSMSAEERDAVVTSFESEPGPRVLLMSLRAGGVGLNLQSASLVIMFDRWWNPAVEMQAIYRAHRFSRATPLHVVRLLTADSVEERIDQILTEKQALFDEFVEGATGSEPQTLTRAELVRALGLQLSDVNETN